MALSVGKKTNPLYSLANGHDDMMTLWSQKISVLSNSIVAIIGYQMLSNLPKAVFCG